MNANHAKAEQIAEKARRLIRNLGKLNASSGLLRFRIRDTEVVIEVDEDDRIYVYYFVTLVVGQHKNGTVNVYQRSWLDLVWENMRDFTILDELAHI